MFEYSTSKITNFNANGRRSNTCFKKRGQFSEKKTTQHHTGNSIDSVLNKTQNTEKREGYREMSP